MTTHRLHHATSLAVLVLSCFVHDVSAQPTPLVPGTRIRFGATEGQPTVDGTIISQIGDTTVLANTAGMQYRVTASSLTSYEVYRGRSSSKGAKKGALWAAGISMPFVLLAVGGASGGKDQPGTRTAIA